MAKIELKKYYKTMGLESLSNVVYDVDFIAKLVHQLNDTYRAMVGEEPKGDWDSLPEEVKDSTRKGVIYIIQNPDATPEEIHAKWVEERECEGWSFGEVMDEEAKTHPCLTPYDKLPVEHRMKDHLYSGVVKAVLDTLVEDKSLSVSTECDCSYTPGMWS